MVYHISGPLFLQFIAKKEQAWKMRSQTKLGAAIQTISAKDGRMEV